MADQRLNRTGLNYFWNRIKTVFATKTEVNTLSDRVDDIIAEGGEQNVIEAIKVNGTTQNVSNKTVYIIVPSNVSDLNNDRNYLTEDEVDAKVNAVLATVYKLQDPVPTFADLPLTGNEKGDVRDVQETGMNYEWNGTAWEPMGHLIDTSAFWSKTELTAITTAEIDAIIDGTGS